MTETRRKKRSSTPVPAESPAKASKVVASKNIEEDPNQKAPRNQRSSSDIKAKTSDIYYNFAMVSLSLLAFITRAWMIHHPGEVVFDEVHFGKFASYYLRQEYYFDVHPPLGKMLLGLVAWLVGYDGHFLFDNIGDNYAEHNVPYIALRLWCCLCGAGIVPFAFLIMKEMGVSVVGCIFGSLLLVFDTALTTQSRLILLDSMLMFFCVMALYFWVKFHASRHNPFSLEWWFWLSMTGVGLALVTGVKMVGLFTVATVGIATLVDLWELLDIKRGHSMIYFGKHFAARALCLIVLPFILYLVPFYLHFAILKNSGPGDNFMSLEFQSTLSGNTKTKGATNVPYGSLVTLQHQGTDHYLHSHPHNYPLRHEDGTVSSQGQQVNAYVSQDQNSLWQVEPVDPSLYTDPFELSDKEESQNVRWLKHEGLFRLRHVGTDSWLVTHDVASPLTKTNMEVTTLGLEKAMERYNETIWSIHLHDADAGDKTTIQSKKNMVFIKNVIHNVALHTFKRALPEWGFRMQEVNGNKKTTESSNRWTFINVTHSTIAVEKEEEENKVGKKKDISFARKFIELQGLMIHHNNQLTKSHPYSSAPITWPFVIRGISFWETKEGLKQIYLLGNPFAWWLAFAGPCLYVAMWIIDRLILRRGIDDMGGPVRKWWDRSIGFLLLAWFMHWAPFFLMGRMLFLHHYMPAYIFSVVTTATLLDFLFRDFIRPIYKTKDSTPMKEWRGQVSWTFILFIILVGGLVVYGFYYFSPLCYGLGFPSVEELRKHKWFPTWDLQYA